MDVDKLFKVSQSIFNSIIDNTNHFVFASHPLLSLSLSLSPQLPKLPSSSLNKRKWAEPTAESLKAAKTQDSDSPSSSKRPPSASVQDVDDQDRDPDDDGEFAPGNDADYFIEDDDEGGRFYGGGLTDTQKRILEVMNRDRGPDQEKVSWIVVFRSNSYPLES